ncbi:hypothetical protein C8F01DRAFT_1295575 [Mycena amicta]|nr:hypothetical protein C8F01DRAFT_1295575 [Mycena amicta]
MFADMLALPTPPEAETYEGCAFVRLADSAEDVCHFLKALVYYDYFEPSPAPTTFAIVAGILRLSHKYQVAPLRQRAILHLSDAFSPGSDLDAYPTRANTRSSALLRDIKSVELPSIIVISRQCSLEWILPRVFYDLCKSEPEAVEILTSPLSTRDMGIFFDGRRQLEVRENTKMLEFLWTPSIDGCTTSFACRMKRARLRLRLKAECWQTIITRRYIMPLEIWDEDDWHMEGMPCETCITEMKQLHEQARIDLWNRLPSIFGLPAWDVLRTMKEDALKRQSTAEL